MCKVVRLRLVFLCLTVLAMSFYTATASAQNSTSGSGTEPNNVAYQWQVDQGTVTTTFKGVATFNLPAGKNSGSPVPINLHNGTMIHEVHGNVTITGVGASTDTSIIVELRTDTGNTIMSVKLDFLGNGTLTVPISGTFATPLQVNSQLSWDWYVDNPGNQAINMALVMN